MLDRRQLRNGHAPAIAIDPSMTSQRPVNGCATLLRVVVVVLTGPGPIPERRGLGFYHRARNNYDIPQFHTYNTHLN